MKPRCHLHAMLIASTCLSIAAPSAMVHVADDFEGDSGLSWSTPVGGPADLVVTADEPRLTPTPNTGEQVMRVTADGSNAGVSYVLSGPAGQNMSVEAWVFCEGNDAGDVRAGYQGILARSSYLGGDQNMIRLAWDPDHSEAGDTGDGWVKLQAYDGSTWDYLGIDPADHGASADGYIVNGTTWPSGWHRFRLEVSGEAVAAYVDDMETPVAEGTLSITLRDGQPGLYVFTQGDWAGHFDDFAASIEIPPPPPPADFDVLILNGTVIRDGDTAPAPLDIGVIGDRIASMEADLSAFSAHEVIDAEGLLVVPGFIDVHSHADGGGNSVYTRQGVTTIVAGNCGGSSGVGSMAAHLAGREGNIAANYITLVGHNNLRSRAGLSGSTPTAGQLDNMRNTLAQAMEDGAFGLSTGLIYATGFNSSTEEIIALAEVAHAHGGLYASHIRGEGEPVLMAVAEAIAICQATGIPTQISHVKCAGPAVWNLSDEYLALVDAALAEGLPIMMDQYPYTASQTRIDVLFPTWALSNWSDAVTNHRAELEEDTRALIAGRGGADRIFFISGPFGGQWLDAAAANQGKDPEDLLIDDVGPGGANAIYHQMIEEDVQVFMQHPLVMMGSDGPTGSHPRGQGTFARLWGHYGRELGMFDWQELVSKTSTLAMRQFLLDRQQRGALRPGWHADIVVLDPETIIDRATYESPGTMPLGMRWTLVNGQIAVENGANRNTVAGRVLRLQDSHIPAGQMLR